MIFCLIIFMEDLVRGLPLSTSAPRGSKNRPILRTNSKYYGGADKGGEGVQNPENFADVLDGFSLT